MYTIWTRSNDKPSNKWEHMLDGFESPHEALNWLIMTYQPNAEFWINIDVKVIKD